MGTEQVDIAIVGSGLGGLSCGTLLARYGFEVVVCESHAMPPRSRNAQKCCGKP
jgi:phytoene dehydrogenase-like protein